MKRQFHAFYIPLAFALTGCGGLASDKTNLEVAAESTLGISWEDYRDQAKAAGGEGYFVVDWDIVFVKEQDLRSYYELTVTRDETKLAAWQQISNPSQLPIFTRDEAREIDYCVSTAFSNYQTVKSDMLAATQAWQDIADVIFRHQQAQDASCSQNTANVDFAVMPIINGCVAGCAMNKKMWFNACLAQAVGILEVNYPNIPLGTKAGCSVTAADSGWTPQGVMRHELGHMLGFRHEHPWAANQGPCTEPVSFGGTSGGNDSTGTRLTPGWDQLSVMYYHHCNGIAGADFTLSETDGTGTRSLYGMPVSWYPAVLSPIAL